MVVTTLGMNTDKFRCVATNLEAPSGIVSTEATLTVNAPLFAPVFGTAPVDQIAVAGATATFTAVATGNPTPALKWQRSAQGTGVWTDLVNDATYGSVATGTLTVVTTLGMNTDKFRCVATNTLAATNSTAATLTVNAAPVVNPGPQDRIVTAGATATFVVEVTGNPKPTLKWQRSAQGTGTWTDLTEGAPYSGVTTTSLTVVTTLGMNTDKFRCVATNSVSSVNSPAATLTVNAATTAPVFVTDPIATGANAGSTATFIVAATGNPMPALKWQRSVQGTGAWTDLTEGAPYSNVATDTLTVVTTLGMNTDKFRCVATNSVSATNSAAASLTVNVVTVAPVFAIDPVNRSATDGDTVTFTATATGIPTPTLKWQRSALGTGTWTDLANDGTYGGVTTGALTVVTTLGMNTDTFRCVATNSKGATNSALATLTVVARTSAPVFVTDPIIQFATEGDTATFTASATGNPAPTLKWQRSALGTGAWADLANDGTYGGVTTGTLTVVTTLAMSTDKFRCVAANSVSATNSAEATLTVTVAPPPVIVTQPASKWEVAGKPVVLSVTASRASSYQWFKGGVAVSGITGITGATGATGATFTIPSIGSSDAGIYDVVVKGPGGDTLSMPAVVGLVPAAGDRTSGSVATRTEWQGIHHPNGSIYDQFLLSGPAGTFTAAPGKIARMSFIDENHSIVQVEMSGAGAITVVLAGATGPMAPALYRQPGIQYMQGKATIILAGADETTHFTIYSVGTFTNPGVTSADYFYDGWADVAVAGIVSTNGKLGGIHQGNVNFNAELGYTGIIAPTVTSVGQPVVVHGITASKSAQPYLKFGIGGAVNVKIAGSDLAQPNTDSITVQGLAQVTMGAGRDSNGAGASNKSCQGHLADVTGGDVTNKLVVGP